MDLFHVTLILVIVIMFLYILELRMLLNDARTQQKHESDALRYWQDRVNFYENIALKALRTSYEQQKGIRRLVEKNKKLKKELHDKTTS